MKMRLLKRDARTAGRLAKANFRRLSQPLKLTFAVTYWCQYRCQTCNIWQQRPKDELSTEEMRRFIDRNDYFSWVDITGGEIFLRRDIEFLLMRMLDQWRHLSALHFPTNGFQTDKIVRCVESLARKKATRLIVTVSVDGDQPTNDAVRGVKGGFERQLRTFKALRNIAGVRATLGMTISEFNTGQYRHTFEACRKVIPDLRQEEMHLNVMQLSDHYYGNRNRSHRCATVESLLQDVDAQHQAHVRASGPVAWLEQQYLQGLREHLVTGATPIPCHALRSSCFINPWGEVYPCITYDNKLGSLRESDYQLAPIWDDVEATQKEIWQGQCPGCWTACEAYQSILGNALRRRRAVSPARPKGPEPIPLRVQR